MVDNPGDGDSEAIIWQGRYLLAQHEAEKWQRQTMQFERAARMLLLIRPWTVRVPPGEYASAYDYPFQAPSPARVKPKPRERPPVKVAPQPLVSIPAQRRTSHPAAAELTERALRNSNRGGRA